MKKIFTTLLAVIALSCAVFAQSVPQGFNYQAVARNSAGQLMNNQTLSVRVNILQGDVLGTSVYQQTNTVSTNANGLFSIIVGEGSVQFANINWANGPYFISSEVDFEGNGHYDLNTTQKIMAVPYATYAEVANRISSEFTYDERDPLFREWGLDYNQLVNKPNFIDSLNFTIHGDTLFYDGDRYVILPFDGITIPGSIEWDSVRNHPIYLSYFINDLGFISTETQGLSDVISINNNAYGQIKNLDFPTDPLDAVNKAYADSILAASIDSLGNALNDRIDNLSGRVDTLYSWFRAHRDSMNLVINNINNRIDSINNTFQNLLDSANTRIYQLEHPRVKGALNGIFSISANTRINFSQGNLQYRPRIKTWRFAAHQYDIAGSDNNNIYMQSACTSWLDLFGYGTSGWDGGAASYMPYETTPLDNFYTEAVDGNDLTEFYANADWGFYNPIINGGNQTGMWRTLTYSEWTYLLTQRPNAANLKGMATVESVPGYVLLPDDWTCPAGQTFVNTDTSFAINVYSATDWASMEVAGAVFLPAAGSRTASSTSNIGNIGNYWSASHVNGTTGYSFHIGAGANIMQNTMTYSTGCSVRLVREY